MCTVVILRRPGHGWPLLLAANRDEMLDRPWKAPGRHWPDRPEVVAGLDEEAGGSWLGINDQGVVATVLNRHGTLGPMQGKRSRGELVLEALDHADAIDAAKALADLDPSSYRPFNMLIADNRDAVWLCHRAAEFPIRPSRVEEGVSMLTAHDLNDEQNSPRVRRSLPRFRSAKAPDPAHDDWTAWSMLMGTTDRDGDAGPSGAMSFQLETGFGTSSSALLALPAAGEGKPVFLFAAGRPDRAPYEPVKGFAPPVGA